MMIETSAGVLGCSKQDLLVATLDQDLGYCFRQFSALRNCKEVGLSFDSRIFKQRFLVQAFGLAEDGAGYLDRIIGRKFTNDARWRLCKWGKTHSEKRLCGNLDFDGQADEHVVKQKDLIFRKIVCTDYK